MRGLGDWAWVSRAQALHLAVHENCSALGFALGVLGNGNVAAPSPSDLPGRHLQSLRPKFLFKQHPKAATLHPTPYRAAP